MLRIIEELTAEGFKVSLYTPKNDELAAGLKIPGIEIYKFKFPLINSLALDTHFSAEPAFNGPRGWMLFLINRIKYSLGVKLISGVIGKCNPDLVYVNEHAIIQGAEAAGRKGKKCVVHLRSCFNYGKNSYPHKLIKKNINKYCSAVFAISGMEKEMLDLPADSKISVETVGEFLPEKPVAVSKSAEEIKKEYYIPPGKKIVLSMAGILNIKGGLIFLKAAEILRSKYENVVFVLAGKIYHDGSDKIAYYWKNCSRIIKRLEAKRSLFVTGEVQDINELLYIADIVTVNSIESHFSRPVIEAWSHRRPVIASDVQHHKNMISDGIDGLLYDSVNALDLAAKIEELLSDPAKCNSLALAGFDKTVNVYSKDNTLGKIVRACKRLTEENA